MEIEAHGTGTSLGDPIEIEGLTRAFRQYTDKKQYCRIGSVKTNVGHLEYIRIMKEDEKFAIEKLFLYKKDR